MCCLTNPEFPNNHSFPYKCSSMFLYRMYWPYKNIWNLWKCEFFSQQTVYSQMRQLHWELSHFALHCLLMIGVMALCGMLISDLSHAALHRLPMKNCMPAGAFFRSFTVCCFSSPSGPLRRHYHSLFVRALRPLQGHMSPIQGDNQITVRWDMQDLDPVPLYFDTL